ncbi:MAG: CoA-binding protein [Candidatus Helarchaeota archaeon]
MKNKNPYVTNSIKKNTDFNALFYPRNIIIVGASKRQVLGKDFFIVPLSKSGYPKDRIFLVNPKYVGDTARGLKFYASLKDIPEPNLDLVITSVKAELVPDIVKEAVEKEVKFVLIFTSGFSELLTPEGYDLTKKVLKIIKGTKTRIIGPNCLGPLCPKSKVTYNALASMKSGNIAFASQSGGHAMMIVEVQEYRFLYFSKGLSFGNQIDVNCVEILDYYLKDPDTEVIGMYLESTGSAEPGAFFQKMKEVCPKKPVIIWKGGQTDAGWRAAASHTGAIASSLMLWESAIKQAGGILVEDSGQFWDQLYIHSRLVKENDFKYPKGDRIAVIVPGGGNSVEITDIFTKEGLQINELPKETQDRIIKMYPKINTSVKNPIDTGSAGSNLDLLIKTIKILDQAGTIDIIILYLPVHWLKTFGEFVGVELITSMARSFGRLNKKLNSQLIIISPFLVVDEEVAKISMKFRETLHNKNVLCFFGIRDAAIALRKIIDYAKFHNK